MTTCLTHSLSGGKVYFGDWFQVFSPWPVGLVDIRPLVNYSLGTGVLLVVKQTWSASSSQEAKR